MARSERFEVLIIGAGPAGIAAACMASYTAKVCIVDDNPSPGGQIWRGGKPPAGDSRAASLLRRFQKLNIERLHNTQIVSAPATGVLLAEQEGRSIELAYKKLILATGAVNGFFLSLDGLCPTSLGRAACNRFSRPVCPFKENGSLLRAAGRCCFRWPPTQSNAAQSFRSWRSRPRGTAWPDLD